MSEPADPLSWLSACLSRAGGAEALDVSTYYGATTARGEAFAAIAAVLPQLLGEVRAAREYTSLHRNCWCPVCCARVETDDAIKAHRRW